MTTAIQHAWENLSNTLRLYVESHMDFAALYKVDRPDAVTRQDRALEAKLEKFHTLYDVTKHVPGFDFFKHADTSLLIVMRNAIHHRDHPLFVSWEASFWPTRPQKSGHQTGICSHQQLPKPIV